MQMTAARAIMTQVRFRGPSVRGAARTNSLEAMKVNCAMPCASRNLSRGGQRGRLIRPPAPLVVTYVCVGYASVGLLVELLKSEELT